MKRILTNRNKNVRCHPISLLIIVCAVVAVPLLSSARPSATSIVVTNNSSREIRYLYLSPVEQDNWGADQLNNASLNTGQAVTLNNVSCSGGQIKVIAEDRDGCFLYGVVNCAGNAQWTITNETPADCGTN